MGLQVVIAVRKLPRLVSVTGFPLIVISAPSTGWLSDSKRGVTVTFTLPGVSVDCVFQSYAVKDD